MVPITLPELAVGEFANVVREIAGRIDVANLLKVFDAKAARESTDIWNIYLVANWHHLTE